VISFKQFLAQILQEKAPAPVIKMAGVLLSFVQSKFPVDEIEKYRGKYYDTSGYYQIRVKPRQGEELPDDMLDQLFAIMKSPSGKKFGFENVRNDQDTGNSGKYSGITFTYADGQYEFMLGQGVNKGEKFESDLLKAMQDYIDGEYNELAEKAFTALEGIDPKFSPENIVEVKKRSGSTKRSVETKMEDVGKIVADIIVKTEDGEEHYISVKNMLGKTIANIGIAAALSKDLKVDVKSPEYKTYMLPFGLDVKRIEDGLKAHQTKVPVETPSVDDVDKRIQPNSTVMKLLKKLWGTNYIYLREKGDDITAMEITEEYLEDELLNNLKITRISYPSEKTKQITIKLESTKANYDIEYRATTGGYTPLQVQFRITKFNP